MAITAAITLSSATGTTGSQVIATCTISNSGGSAVTVQSCTPVGYVSASTYRDFVTAAWTDAVGADFGAIAVTTIGENGQRGDSSIDIGGVTVAVPVDGTIDLPDPLVTLTLPPSWYSGESASFSATGGDITVTNSGQPQFPSVSLIFGVPTNNVDATNVTVPASGSLTLKFNVLPQSPAPGAADQAFDIGATVVTSGGVTTYATIATLTVSARDI